MSKQPKLKTSLKVIFFIGLVVLLGFLRETLFVRIEWYEKVVTEQADPPARFWLFAFLENLSYKQLVFCRYGFTLVFTAVFYGLSLLLVRWFFHSPAHVRMVNIVFLAVLSFTVLLFTLGWLTGQTGSFYEISRYVIGLVETPLVIILLFPLFWVSRKMAQ